MSDDREYDEYLDTLDPDTAEFLHRVHYKKLSNVGDGYCCDICRRKERE